MSLVFSVGIHAAKSITLVPEQANSIEGHVCAWLRIRVGSDELTPSEIVLFAANQEQYRKFEKLAKAWDAICKETSDKMKSAATP